MGAAPRGLLPQQEHQERLARINPEEFAAEHRAYFGALSPEDQLLIQRHGNGEADPSGELHARAVELHMGFEAHRADTRQMKNELRRQRRSGRRSAPIARRTRTRTRERRSSSARRTVSRSAGGGDDGPSHPAPEPPERKEHRHASLMPLTQAGHRPPPKPLTLVPSRPRTPYSFGCSRCPECGDVLALVDGELICTNSCSTEGSI